MWLHTGKFCTLCCQLQTCLYGQFSRWDMFTHKTRRKQRKQWLTTEESHGYCSFVSATWQAKCKRRRVVSLTQVSIVFLLIVPSGIWNQKKQGINIKDY